MFQLEVTSLQAVRRQVVDKGSSMSTEGVSEGKGETNFKVSDGEKSRIRRMHRLPDNAGENCFQKWFWDFFDK